MAVAAGSIASGGIAAFAVSTKGMVRPCLPPQPAGEGIERQGARHV
jgi:hypothetical protein